MPFDPQKDYWAAKPINEATSEAIKKVEDYYKYMRETGMLGLYLRLYEYYYMAMRSGGMIYSAGMQAEYTKLDVNDFRNLILHLKTMIMSQRIAFDPQAVNTDHESEEQTILAKSILETELREGGLEEVVEKVVEMGILFADSWLELDWDANDGEDYEVVDGKIIKEGKLVSYAYSPLNAIVEAYAQEPRFNWVITRKFKNKYDLAALFPEKADEILAVSIKNEFYDTMPGSVYYRETEIVPVYTLHHYKTPALPEGRMIQFLDANVYLLDSPYPHAQKQIYHFQPSNQENTWHGYSVSFDMLALQQAANNLYSTIATNQANFGVQNILVPEGHNMSFISMADGLNALTYNPELGKPEALNLLSTKAETFEFLAMIKTAMQILAGVPETARGDLNKLGDLSGTAMALLQATALQFNSDLQKSYAKLMEKSGSGIISVYQQNAETERVARIVGKSNQFMISSWNKDKIDRIKRVTVDLGNPLTRTTSGKVAIADQLLAHNMVENPDQYIEVIETGRLDPMIQGKRAELLNMQAENEELAAGRQVPVVFTDAHAQHIIEHKAVIAPPTARRNPKVVAVVTAHIQQHLDMLRSTDPAMLAILGQQPVATPAPQGGGIDIPPPLAATGVDPLQDSNAGLPKQPNVPINPLTGKRFSIAGGI